MESHSRSSDWQSELNVWAQPFLERLAHPSQQHWAEVYLWGLLGPGDRKSVEAMASRVAPGATQQLHHFLSTSSWDPGPLETMLVEQAQRLVGGADTVLCVDDTALVKKGEHSVGVAPQYCGQLGKKANCQALVSLTLARREVPVCIGLRLYLPDIWVQDAGRRLQARIPLHMSGHPKWRLALDEIDRVRAAGAVFGCVTADAEYGKAADFRAGLAERGLTYAVGVGPTQKVYPADVRLEEAPDRATGRPTKHPAPSVDSRSIADTIAALPEAAFRRLSWRQGTKGPLQADFAAVRVRVGDGPLMSKNRHLPGSAAWLVCERRLSGERKYYLTSHAEATTLEHLAAAIKARWVGESRRTSR
ncbi:SRSO17 transposase [Azospirillum doebereinerae]|uniref:IS701 family transposase n=1 Tax=Azospirillum doebereinerae TaxID=92933 RepID=A0A3S0WQE1_9PROT|nr:IS701 family transposase [Azospirillum doebereinerae]RUQ61386.1 IS701 family transposase [Azospirillum doebereinerae]